LVIVPMNFCSKLGCILIIVMHLIAVSVCKRTPSDHSFQWRCSLVHTPGKTLLPFTTILGRATTDDKLLLLIMPSEIPRRFTVVVWFLAISLVQILNKRWKGPKKNKMAKSCWPDVRDCRQPASDTAEPVVWWRGAYRHCKCGDAMASAVGQRREACWLGCFFYYRSELGSDRRGFFNALAQTGAAVISSFPQGGGIFHI